MGIRACDQCYKIARPNMIQTCMGASTCDRRQQNDKTVLKTGGSGHFLWIGRGG